MVRFYYLFLANSLGVAEEMCICKALGWYQKVEWYISLDDWGQKLSNIDFLVSGICSKQPNTSIKIQMLSRVTSLVSVPRYGSTMICSVTGINRWIDSLQSHPSSQGFDKHLLYAKVIGGYGYEVYLVTCIISHAAAYSGSVNQVERFVTLKECFALTKWDRCTSFSQVVQLLENEWLFIKVLINGGNCPAS